MSNTNSSLFCTDSSMDSVIMSSPSSQMPQPQMAKFPPIKSAPDGRQSKVAVVYSSDYSAKTSLDELFDPAKIQRAQKPWRQRNLPNNFFDQSSASSSTSHSRDSLDSPNLNSPKRMSVAPNEVGSNHLSLKRNVKAKPMDPMDFNSKTRSLPCSFSPSKYDPSLIPNATPQTVSRNLNPNQNNIQLESFTQLQQGLMSQSRLKSNEPNTVPTMTATATSVSSINNNIGPNIIFNINTTNPCHLYQLNPNPLSSRPLMQTTVPVQTQQVIHSNSTSVNQMSGQQFSHSPMTSAGNNHTMQHNSALQDQSKEETFLHGLAQLENERTLMRKRQLELLQAKLIGPNRGTSNPTTTMHQQSDSFVHQPSSQHQSHHTYESLMSGQNLLIKPQSRQESIDSGLDLLCYSSSTESTNRVSPELFMQLGNATNLVTMSSIVDAMQPYSNQFGPAVVNKLITSPSATGATGLFDSNHDLVAQATNDNFDRLKLTSGVGGLKSDPLSTLANSNFLSYPTNNGALFEYEDSMSIASSPSTLDGNTSLNQESQLNRLVLGSVGDSIALNQMQSSPMYDDNIISSFLNNESDIFDFNGNFTGLSGHGGTSGVSDLHEFSYNL